ncbi:hypothetical protein H311_03672 [Anncaliia algerae PRA109]|nr:hypothetical protein H311_03672 [Anncaliia algerae PRA109]
MYVKIELQDKVSISISSQEKEMDTLKALNNKYSNKLTEVGLGISITKVIKYYYFKIIDDKISVKVDFEGLFYRLIHDELCYGKLILQNEDGLMLDVKFIGNVFIPKKYLDDEFEIKKMSNNQFYWCWKYNNFYLYFYNDDIIRFKVVINKGKILGRINETGLGPIKWWD